MPDHITCETLNCTKVARIGEAGMSYGSHKCKATFAATATPLASGISERYTGVTNVSDGAQFTVPKGSIVTGFTLKPIDDHIGTAKDLPTSIKKGQTAPLAIGEVALSIHRTDLSLKPLTHHPFGTYVLAGNTDHNNEKAPVAGKAFAAGNGFNDYFQYFVANCAEGTESAAMVNPAPTTKKYRGAIEKAKYTGQAGAPVVYVDASRTLFANIRNRGSTISPQGIYVPFESGTGLIGDGTWGIGIGLIGQCEADAQAKATVWPALEFEMTVFTVGLV